MKVCNVVLHCSDSAWGDAAEVDRWHRERRFRWAGGAIGYHYVVLNGRPGRGAYVAIDDARVEDGRPESIAGAHVAGRNHDTIGVCMIGPAFTEAQLAATARLCAAICAAHGLGAIDVLGHCETLSGGAQGKTCPVTPMEPFRARVSAALLTRELTPEATIRAAYVARYEGGAMAPSWRSA